MRKLVYYVACSTDGFIAQEDGSSEGFLAEGQHLADLFAAYPETLPTHLQTLLGVKAETRVFDTVLMGRSTYEVGLKEGITSPYQSLKQYVFSTTLQANSDDSIHFIQKDAAKVVADLKQEQGKDIWLCGGGKLASVLFEQIDRLILKVNPFLMGVGIPLFASKIEDAQLELTKSRVYDNGFALFDYTVKH